MKRIILGVCFSIIFYSSSLAQNFCGTPEVDMESWIAEMKAHHAYPDFSKKLNIRSTINVPIHYHIISNSSGKDGFPLYWVMKMHYDINRNYRNNNVGVQFYLDSISFASKDAYFNIGVNSTDDDNMANEFNTLMSCNVYLVNNPKGNCGYTQRPQFWNTPASRSSIYVAASAGSFQCSEPGSTTLTHEMGHWLNLPHTFNGWEGFTYGSGTQPRKSRWEKVVRTGPLANCRTMGDGFCDTEPDYASYRWPCPYSKVFVDSQGVNFTLNPNNYMCYTTDSCMNKFTAEQIIQINNCFTTYKERSDFPSLSYPDYGSLDTFKSFAPKTLKSNERIIKDQLKFVFDKQDNAQKYLFTLFQGNASYAPNFKVYPSNILLDTFITTNEFKLPSNLVLSEAIWYYWTVQPVNKTNGFDYGTPLQGFRIGNISLDATVTAPKCFGDNATVKLSNNSGDNTMVYSVDGVKYTSDSIFEVTTPNTIEAYFKKTNGTIYKIALAVLETKKVGGEVTVNVNKVIAKGIDGTSPYTYEWSTGSKNASLTLDSGKYILTVKDANGCISDPIEVKVNNKIRTTTSISTFDTDNSVNLYPTIVAFGEKISINNLSGRECTLEVYSIDGKQVYSQLLEVTQGKATFDWNQKNQGVYLLKVKYGENEKSFKIQSK